jgi:branched-chain amino acid transport system permease protein
MSKSWLRRWQRLIFWVGLAIILAILPQITQLDPFWAHIANEIAIYVILAAGMNLAMGYGGQINLAIGALFGVGAYSTALVMLHNNGSFLVGFAVSAILSAIIATLIGLPSLRVRSHYLALVTLGLGIALDIIFVNWESVTGGAIGLTSIPFASIGGLQFDDETKMSYLFFGIMLIMLLIAAVFIRSRFGRNLKAMRDDLIAARAMGINVGIYQLACFAFSGFYAGVAGSLYAVWLSYINPTSFDLNQSIFILAQTLVGGMGTLIGPVIGATTLVGLQQYLLAFGDLQLIIYGGLIVVLVLVARGGIAGGLIALWQFLKKRRRREENAPAIVDTSTREASMATSAATSPTQQEERTGNR